MASSSWLRWLRSFVRPQSRAARRNHRLDLESLEDRLAPASFIWTGGGGAANPNWSNPANWLTGAPTGLGLANQPEDLSFGTFAPAAFRNATNDIAPNGGAAKFNSITISASGYDLKGVPLT